MSFPSPVQWNAGNVALLGSGLAITGSGAAATIDVTGSVAPLVQNYYSPLTPALGNNALTTSAVATNCVGNKITVQQQMALRAIYVYTASLVNGGNYQMQVAIINGSNVVQSFVQGAGIVALSTAQAVSRLAFPAGGVTQLNPGSIYFIGMVRTDGLGTAVLPVSIYAATQKLQARYMDTIDTRLSVANAGGLANGVTLTTAVGAPMPMAFDIQL